MELLTLKKKDALKQSASNQIIFLKNMIDDVNSDKLIIADIGANIGYFSESFLEHYPNSIVHAYEPHPLHFQELDKLNNSRLVLHPYGLFNSNGTFTIGMRSDGKFNNGTFGIFDKQDSIEVEFKNANEEKIRPHIVKIDVEGSEFYILQCADFFSETKAVLVELLYNDSFGMNLKVTEALTNLGFYSKAKIGKNDYLWFKK